MNAMSYGEVAIQRIAHIKSHLDGGFKVVQAVRNIENNLGNARACVINLSSHAQASAMYAWIEHRDIRVTRQWCHVAGKLTQRWLEMAVDTTGPGGKMLQLLHPLLSNNVPLIKWFAHYDLAFDMERIENHKTHDFWAYQAMLALRGEWNRLIERCKRIEADPPGASDEQRYLLDHKFYYALAQRDTSEMQKILARLVEPKLIRARRDDESGFTEGLISTPAVIYAKISQWHGHQIKVESPYIPSEWLSAEPLERYANHYSFLVD